MALFLPFNLSRLRFNSVLYRVNRFIDRPRLSCEKCLAFVEGQRKLAGVKKKKRVGMVDRLGEME